MQFSHLVVTALCALGAQLTNAHPVDAQEGDSTLPTLPPDWLEQLNETFWMGLANATFTHPGDAKLPPHPITHPWPPTTHPLPANFTFGNLTIRPVILPSNFTFPKVTTHIPVPGGQGEDTRQKVRFWFDPAALELLRTKGFDLGELEKVLKESKADHQN